LEVKSIRLGGGDEPVRHLLLLDDLGDFAGGIVLVVGLEVGRPADRRPRLGPLAQQVIAVGQNNR
jgi:hypothetical protein